MKANLSRIHNLISHISSNRKKVTEDARRPIDDNGRDFIFSILESTTDADMEEYRRRLDEKRNNCKAKFERASKMVEYCSYLRELLSKANQEHGVSAKLLELDNLRQMLDNLNEQRGIILLSYSQGLRQIKNADYYKTSFTDSNKIYDLAYNLFSNSDLEEIDRRISEIENKSFEIKNEIAVLNQSTIIEIMNLDEFEGNNPERN